MRHTKILLLAIALLLTVGAIVNNAPIARAAHTPVDHYAKNTVTWALPTVDGRMITESTYQNRVQIIVIYDPVIDTDSGAYSKNSAETLSAISNSAWVANDRVKVITIGCGTREQVRSFRERFANNSADMVFCYTSKSMTNNLIHSFDSIMHTNSDLNDYPVNFVIDTQNNLRFTWQGEFSDGYYKGVLEKFGINYSDITESGVHKTNISGTGCYSDAYSALKILNDFRTKNGLQKLVMDKDLLKYAMKRAAELAVYYSHTRPDGTRYSTISDKADAENIAVSIKTPEAVTDMWIDSSDASRNMLNKSVKSVGIGCFKDSNGQIYWVQLFSSDSGTAEETVTEGDKKRTYSIKLDSSYMNLSLPSRNLTVDKDGSATVRLQNINKAYPDAAPVIYVTYADYAEKKSSNKKIATIEISDDGTARINAVGEGTVSFMIGIKLDDSDSPETFFSAVKLEVTVVKINNASPTAKPPTATEPPSNEPEEMPTPPPYDTDSCFYLKAKIDYDKKELTLTVYADADYRLNGRRYHNIKDAVLEIDTPDSYQYLTCTGMYFLGDDGSLRCTINSNKASVFTVSSAEGGLVPGKIFEVYYAIDSYKNADFKFTVNAKSVFGMDGETELSSYTKGVTAKYRVEPEPETPTPTAAPEYSSDVLLWLTTDINYKTSELKLKIFMDADYKVDSKRYNTVNGGRITVNYPSRYLSRVQGAPVSSICSLSNIMSGGDILSFRFTPTVAGGSIPSGQIMELTFQINCDTNADFEFTIDPSDIAGVDGTALSSEGQGTTASYVINLPDDTAGTVGDVNNSGEIDAGDASLVLRHVVGTAELTEDMRTRADINKNGLIDAGDATMILRIVVGVN